MGYGLLDTMGKYASLQMAEDGNCSGFNRGDHRPFGGPVERTLRLAQTQAEQLRWFL